jgi:hypothetical protein
MSPIARLIYSNEHISLAIGDLIYSMEYIRLIYSMEYIRLIHSMKYISLIYFMEYMSPIARLIYSKEHISLAIGD